MKFPLPPFGRTRAEGKRQIQDQPSERRPSRSGSERHDAGNQRNLPSTSDTPARGVTFAPAQQADASGHRQGTRITNSPRPPTAVSRSDPIHTSSNTRGSPDTTGSSARWYPIGEAGPPTTQCGSKSPPLFCFPKRPDTDRSSTTTFPASIPDVRNLRTEETFASKN